MNFKFEPIEINGTGYDHYAENVSQNCQWKVGVDNDDYNLYRFSNSGKYMTLAGKYDDPYRKYRFILTSVEGYSQYDNRYYQPQLQLQNKNGDINIAGRITYPDETFEDMYMFMKDGYLPTEYCTNEFAANFKFYKKVVVNYEEEQLKETPEVITITNKKITKDAPGKSMTVVKKWDDGKDHSKDTVVIQLMSNNVPVNGSEITLSAANNWTYTYTDLKGKDVNGDDIVYFVKETQINGQDIDSLVNSGKYAKPEVKVTKASEGSVIEKEVETSKDYWVPVTDIKADGTYKLEDGESYVIVTNDWMNNNKLIALTAEPETNTLKTKDVSVSGETVEADGVTYAYQLTGIDSSQVWNVSVVNDEFSVYKFTNAGKNMTLAGKYKDPFRKYRFILTSKEEYSQVDGLYYQPQLQLKSKNGGTIIAGRIEFDDGSADDMYLFMKDGNIPTEYCTDEFPAIFNFFKKVTVKEKEIIQEVKSTPEEVTITNKSIPETIQPEKPNPGKPINNVPNTGDTTNILLWVVIAAVAVVAAVLAIILGKKKK